MSQLRYSQRVIAMNPGIVLTRLQFSNVVKIPKPMDIVCILLPLCAIILWSISLRAVDLHYMTDLGLVSVFPPSMIIALIVLTISFCLALGQSRVQTAILLLHLVLLIFMLYNIENLMKQEPHFPFLYQHAGYTEYIMRNGSVDPYLATYFDWPDFFILGALVTRVAGYHDILSFAGWAQLFFNLIYLGLPLCLESFGIVVLEAVAMGQPVVASRIGIVVDGETGLLVPPGDALALGQAIKCLLDDPVLREHMGALAKQRVAEFQAKTVVPRIEQVYQEVLQS